MRSFIILLISLITLSTCENDQAPAQKNIVTESNISDTISQSIEISDSLETVSTEIIKIDSTQNMPSKVESPAESVKDLIDVDYINPDPFKDPDYIGTPCGDYMDGECTRHNHQNDHLEDVYDDIMPDSL